MNRQSRDASHGWMRWVVGAVLVAMAATGLPVRAADHRDGPIFGPPGITIVNSRRDINDIYVFRSPATATNTVFIMTVSPFTTGTTAPSFDAAVSYDFVINLNPASPTDDIVFRATFGPPDASGVQDVALQRVTAPTGILAQGKTRQNLPVTGGGLFRAGEQDDPFFFDATGFAQLLNGGAFPRAPGTATNFFGPNVNTLAISLEIPTSVLGAPGALIGFWGRTIFGGVQIDRMGRPGINTALIPPIPRGSNFPIGGAPDLNRQERRNAFNAGHPANDVANFTADMVSVLQNFYGRTSGDSTAITGLLLPDILVFELGNPNGFGTFVGPGGAFLGNGRRLRDDVIDFEVTVLTNGAITTDNAGDDNGTRITDGNMGTTAAFPYIGTPNPNGSPVTGAPLRTEGDYDADGRTDIVVFRPSTAEYFLLGSLLGVSGPIPFGLPGDIPVPGPYDIDSRTDLAVFRPSTAAWFAFGTTVGLSGPSVFGGPGDVPVPGDYDGDGRTDLAVFRPSTAEWFIFGTTAGFIGPVPFGVPGDIPIPGNYDSDTRTDLAVFRPSTATWFIFNTASSSATAVGFGAPGDVPVPGDYDFDRRTDLAVFRPSTATWFIFGSTAGSIGPFGFGGPGDVPVPGDYDGDGRTDLAVFRPSTAEWFIFGSTAGFMGPTAFGGPGDIPTVRPPALRILLPIP